MKLPGAKEGVTTYKLDLINATYSYQFQSTGVIVGDPDIFGMYYVEFPLSASLYDVDFFKRGFLSLIAYNSETFDQSFMLYRIVLQMADSNTTDYQFKFLAIDKGPQWDLVQPRPVE